MALNADELAVVLRTKINAAIGGNNDAEQKALCQAIAEAIVEYFTQVAEVVIPEHDPKVTDLGGQAVVGGPGSVVPNHRHLIENLTHKIGKIK